MSKVGSIIKGSLSLMRKVNYMESMCSSMYFGRGVLFANSSLVITIEFMIR